MILLEVKGFKLNYAGFQTKCITEECDCMQYKCKLEDIYQ